MLRHRKKKKRGNLRWEEEGGASKPKRPHAPSLPPARLPPRGGSRLRANGGRSPCCLPAPHGVAEREFFRHVSPRAFFFAGCCIVWWSWRGCCWFTGSALPTSRGSRKSSNKTAARQTGTLLRFARRLACLLLLALSSLSHCCCCCAAETTAVFWPQQRGVVRRLEWIARGGSSGEQQVLSLIAATRPCLRTVTFATSDCSSETAGPAFYQSED
ncbi:hypothetical protein MTO96_021996 [Rhipicephalus appendiculatus]